jgi:hypothetical protein
MPFTGEQILEQACKKFGLKPADGENIEGPYRLDGVFLTRVWLWDGKREEYFASYAVDNNKIEDIKDLPLFKHFLDFHNWILDRSADSNDQILALQRRLDDQRNAAAEDARTGDLKQEIAQLKSALGDQAFDRQQEVVKLIVASVVLLAMLGLAGLDLYRDHTAAAWLGKAAATIAGGAAAYMFRPAKRVAKGR